MKAGRLRYTANFYAPADATSRPTGQRPTVFAPNPYAQNWPVSVEATASSEGDLGAGRRSSTTYALECRTPERVPAQQDKLVLNDGTEMFLASVLDDGRECKIVARVEA